MLSKLWKTRDHMVCSLGQSAVFRNFNSANYFPHSPIPRITHPHPFECTNKFLTVCEV